MHDYSIISYTYKYCVEYYRVKFVLKCYDSVQTPHKVPHTSDSLN